MGSFEVDVARVRADMSLPARMKAMDVFIEEEVDLLPCQFTVEEFIEYCANRGDEPYDYQDFENCALAQFLKSKGYGKVRVYTNFYHVECNYHQYPGYINTAVMNYKRQFGHVAKVLKAALA